MKKYFYLLILALVPMCFAACGDDDDEEATGVAGTETLYGVWQSTSDIAFEDGEFHHEHKHSGIDDAEILYFDANGSCVVYGGDNGVLWGADGITYSYTFNQDTGALRIGNTNLTVEVLTKGVLKLKRSLDYGDDYQLVTYKKIGSSLDQISK